VRPAEKYLNSVWFSLYFRFHPESLEGFQTEYEDVGIGLSRPAVKATAVDVWRAPNGHRPANGPTAVPLIRRGGAAASPQTL